MNNEMMQRWTLTPRADEDAVGAALRRAVGIRVDRTPEDLSRLLARLDRRRAA